jgi:hypothetical protein
MGLLLGLILYYTKGKRPVIVMATDNRPVTCYLPKDIEDSLTQYCTEYRITRKDKEGNLQPALGTGIIELLRNLFSNPENVPSPLSGIVPSKIIDLDIESKVRDILPSFLADILPSLLPSTEASKIPDDLITSSQLESAIDYLKSEISPLWDTKKKGEILLGK